MNTFDIDIHVDNEAELYNSFDRMGLTLSAEVMDYISARYTEKHFGDTVRLVFSGASIDIDRMKAALHRYVQEELDKTAKMRSRNRWKQLRLFLIGLIFIGAYFLLDNALPSVPVELLSIVGSFAIWEAANIWIVENPETRLRERFLNRLLQTEVIVEGQQNQE